MKYFTKIAGLILFFSSIAFGQNLTTLNGVLTDSDSQPWINATWNATINVPGGANAQYLSGGTVPTSFTGTLDSAGTFSGSIGNVEQIIPEGVTWNFSLCSLTSAPCQTFKNIAVSGSTFNAGVFFSGEVSAPRIPASALVYAYNPTEIIGDVNGSGYVNTVNQSTFLWKNTAWNGTVSSGSPSLTASVNNYSYKNNCANDSLFGLDNCSNETATFSSRAMTNGHDAQVMHYHTLNAFGKARDIGSLGSVGGWSTGQVDKTYMTSSSRGIFDVGASFYNHYGVGDSITHYWYTFCAGGAIASADEGCKGLAIQMGELTGYFHGTVSSTTGTGDTAPVLNYTSGLGATIDGGMLLDISKGTIATTVTGNAVNVGIAKALPVTASSIPLSSAIGLCSTAIPDNGKVQVNSPFTCNVTLQTINGATPSLTAGGNVCVAGSYPEQAPITAVGTASGGVQSVTVSVRNPSNQPFYIYQGGVCGQYISYDSDLNFPTANAGYRTNYYAFGSEDGTNLMYGFAAFGSLNGAAPPTEPLGTIHLYPGAEIVANTSNGYTVNLEPNSVAWTNGDVVENPHPMAHESTGISLSQQQYTAPMGSASSAMTIVRFGQGIRDANRNPAIHVSNQNPSSWYTGYTIGSNTTQLTAPTLFSSQGATYDGLLFDSMPTNAIIDVPNLGTGQTGTNFNIMRLPNTTVTYNITNGTISIPVLTSNAFTTGTTLASMNFANYGQGNTFYDCFILQTTGTCAGAVMSVVGTKSVVLNDINAYYCANNVILCVSPTSDSDAPFEISTSGALKVPTLTDTDLTTAGCVTNTATGIVGTAPCAAASILSSSVTTTATTFDTVTLVGMLSSGHCSLVATNASAATSIATTYITKNNGSINVNHASTAGMTYDVICTTY